MKLLNHKIEAKWIGYPQAIPSGAGDRHYLAPLFDQVLIHFNKFRKDYEAMEFEEGL